MARHKNESWDCTTDGRITTADAQLAVLMDIRDELQALNRTLSCRNVIGGMVALQRLDKRVAKHWPLNRRKK